MKQSKDRRAFLGALAAFGAASKSVHASQPGAHAEAKGPHTPDTGFRFLREPEIEFLNAALEQLIPSDALGPGAREAGVTRYIDGQLAGAWGAGADQYRRIRLLHASRQSFHVVDAVVVAREIYGQLLLPPLRSPAHLAALRTTWIKRIQQESAKREYLEGMQIVLKRTRLVETGQRSASWFALQKLGLASA